MDKISNVQKEVLENCIRSFLKEIDISHLDALICLIQSLNTLLNEVDKKYGKLAAIEIMKNIRPEFREEFTVASHICVHIGDIINRVRD